MPKVVTVRGPIDAAELGMTLIHEHVMVSLRCYWNPELDPLIALSHVALDNLSRVRANPFASRDNLILDDASVMARELEIYRQAGGHSIVEVTSIGIGRDVRALKGLSEHTGIHLVAGCGYYIEASHPKGLSERSIEALAEEMIAELTQGIEGTSIRAGVIGEIGMSTCPMSATEATVLRAAAAAQRSTGVGVVTHCAPGDASAFEIASILDSAGADLSRVVISHLDERFREDLGLFRKLAATDVKIGLDTFGRDMYNAARGRQHPTDEVRILVLQKLLDAGLGDQLLLSQDVCMKNELEAWGGQGYSHISRHIIPRLREAGISDSEISQLLVRNPATVLAGSS